MAGFDAVIDVLTSNEGTQETTSEGVTGTIGVDNLVVGESIDGVPLGLVGLISRDNNSGLGTLGEDNKTGAGRVGLGEVGNGFRDGRKVLGLRKTGGEGVSFSLGLVTDDDISVGEDLRDLCAEELGNERGRQVENEGLAGIGSLGAQLKSGLGSVGKEVALNVEELGGVDERGDRGGGEMLFLEHLRGAKVGNEGSQNAFLARDMIQCGGTLTCDVQ